MIGPATLRQRLAFALAGFAAVTAVFLSALFWISERLIESAALERLLNTHLDELIAHGRPQAALQPGQTLQYLRPSLRAVPQLPAEITALAAGDHQGLLIADERYHVLVRQLRAGDTAYLLYSDVHEQRRERALALALFAAAALIVIGALRISGGLSRRALAPLEQLVLRLTRLKPGERLPPLPPGSELEVIVAALNEHIVRIDALVERESAFAAAASHELRTPLAVIQGALELLEPQPGQHAALGRIERAVRQARDMLEMLLALSRARAPAPAAELQLDQLLPSLTESEPLPAGLRLQWLLQPCRLRAPQAALEIVFLNLLRNALRAAARSEQGLVTVTLHESGLQLDDNGAGIAPEDLPRVFEPRFKGVDGGSGMGLYIAHSLAERQGWQLSLANREEGGVSARLSWAGH